MLTTDSLDFDLVRTLHPFCLVVYVIELPRFSFIVLVVHHTTFGQLKLFGFRVSNILGCVLYTKQLKNAGGTFTIRRYQRGKLTRDYQCHSFATLQLQLCFLVTFKQGCENFFQDLS